MIINIFFGERMTITSILICLAILSHKAESCNPYNSDESKVDLIKIQLTRDGKTIITIGNLWRLGQIRHSRTDHTVPSMAALISRVTNPYYSKYATHYPTYNDGHKIQTQIRSYHTSQIPIAPPTIVTTRKLMQTYDVNRLRRISGNKRYLDNRDENKPAGHAENVPDRLQIDKFSHVIKNDYLPNQPILDSTAFTSPYANDDVPAHTKVTTNENYKSDIVTTEYPNIKIIQNNLKNTNDFAGKTDTADTPEDKFQKNDINSTKDGITMEDEEIDVERLLVNERLQKIVDNHYSWNILNAEDTDCGESHSDRIIGGVEANLGQFPWIARLGYTVLPDVNQTEYRCGGVLIGQEYVITAAHCVSNLGPRTTMTKVRLGEHDITSSKDCLNGMCAEPVQDFRPINITIHKEFMKRKYANDIAIIKLDRPAINNGWVSPICLPRGAMLKASFIGESANVAGWGVMDMDTHEMAEKLQTVSLPILNLDDCQKEYKKKVQLTEEQICAGGILNKDACGGDSGGPLMKVATENGTPQYFLLGVVSFGPSDCGKKEPGVYANVSYHMPWILDNVERLST